jgi:hypothetical protein
MPDTTLPDRRLLLPPNSLVKLLILKALRSLGGTGRCPQLAVGSRAARRSTAALHSRGRLAGPNERAHDPAVDLRDGRVV